jgi:hypothetical protein
VCEHMSRLADRGSMCENMRRLADGGSRLAEHTTAVGVSVHDKHLLALR